MTALYRSLARLGARRPLLVLGAAAVITLVAALLALRIEVKTSLADTMSDDEPVVARLRHLAENFPGAVTVQVVLEGQEPDRLIEVAKELERGFLESEHVRAVYLEQPVEFFEQRALLYLPTDELRVVLETVMKSEEGLSALLEDPSTLGLLRAAEAVGAATFPAQESALTLRSRLFGDVEWEQALRGRPAANLGLRVDPGPAAKKLGERTTALLQNAPLPPSGPRATELLGVAVSVFDLVADVLEQGERLTPEVFAARVAEARDVDLERLEGQAALPPRYRMNEERTMLLLEVAGKEDLTRLEHIEPVLSHLEAVRARVQQGARDVRVGMTGMPVMYMEEQEAILDNFLLVTLLGLLGILAVFIIGFQRVALPSLATIPLVMGIVWTLGVQGAVDPELNMLNLLFPVLLFGLGIDFAIHIVSGYAQRRGEGKDVEEALVSAYESLAPSLVTGAFTTATAFLVLLFASLKGLRALGFTAGVGVLMALITMLVVLPALLALYDRQRQGKGELLPDVHFSLLERMGGVLQRHRYPVMAGFLAVTVALAYFAPRVTLERDPTKIQPEGMPAAVLQERVLQAFESSGEPSVWFAKDLDEARRIHEAAGRARTIADPLSITMAIPEEQAEKAPLLELLAEELERVAPKEARAPQVWDEASLEELRRRLAGIKTLTLELSALGVVLYGAQTQALLGELRDHINRVDRRLTQTSAERLRYLDRLIEAEVTRSLVVFRAMTTNRSVGVEDLPAALRDRLAGEDGSWMVLARANEYVFGEGFLEAHLAELEAISPEVTGLTPAGARMLEMILSDVPRLTGLTLLAVALVVLFSLRSLRGTLLSLVPLIVGMVWTLGVLGAMGVPFNFVSILAIPLIVGIGIDDGVHLYHRVKHEGALGPALAHSGKAIVLTSMTTGIGFGSLLLSVHRGVFHLGLATALGIFACLIVSLFLLPALIAIFDEGILRERDEDPS